MPNTKYSKLEYMSDENKSSLKYGYDDANENVQTIPLLQTSEDENSQSNFKLQKTVGFTAGLSIVVGTMIGSGIFIVPTGVLKECHGDVSLSMLIWTIGGLIAIIVALCYCELSTTIPQSGGTATFLKKIYGDGLCFVFLWLFMLTATPQATAVQIIALGDYISGAIEVGLGLCEEAKSPYLSKLIGCLITLLVLTCNITNIKLAVKIQVWCAIGKVVALIIIAVAGIVKITIDDSILVQNFEYGLLHGPATILNVSGLPMVKAALSESLRSTPGISGVSLAVFQALWAYDGFDSITCITDEVKNPRRTLPLIIITSVIAVMSLYLIVNLAYFGVLTKKEMITSNAVAVHFAAKVHPWLSYVVTAGVCLSLIGSINVTFLTAGRMPFVAGRMGLMPEILSMVHVKYISPVPALLFLTSLATIMLFPSSIDMLLKANVFTLWAFRGACCAGIFILDKKFKHLKRPYKVYRTTAFLATLVTGYMVLVPLAFRPQILYVLALVLALVFSVIYWFLKREYFVISGVGKVSVIIQKLLLVAPPDDNETCNKFD
ncbi:b(0,+)-type amino acid transporter 1-like [Clavelina lepadiformis]|uniref:b(0,+)-type amino acid transporter 1-like n=1 Tax=Clavelina lepadiformis TaxID=159417 RepID=UPI004042342A